MTGASRRSTRGVPRAATIGRWRPGRSSWIVGDRRSAIVTIAHLRTFLPLLPNWDEAAIGLRAVLLDSATDCYGWYGPGVVALCNWEHDLWDWWDPAEIDEHRDLLDLLCVERVPVEESREYGEFASWFEQRMGEPPRQRGLLELRWTEAQARAFLMLYTLPHELGHHHDRMTNRSRTRLARGEPYAHAYAERALERLWPIYTRHFDLGRTPRCRVPCAWQPPRVERSCVKWSCLRVTARVGPEGRTEA